MSSIRRCSIDTCDRAHYGRGLCNAHYQRLVRLGSARANAPLQRPQKGPCSVEGCERPRYTKGLCGAHAARLRTKGRVDPGDPVGKHWRDDNPNRRRVGATHRNTDGYIEEWNPAHPNAYKSGFVLQHRRIMADVLGRALLPDETVHHKNTDRRDNRHENLELRVGNHGRGGAVDDVLAWAREIVARYG